MKVAHLTSVHQRHDTRILLKECQSLAANGCDVSLIVADGEGDATVANVNIIDLGKSSGRWQRILLAPRKVYLKALVLDADIYHLHDPELLPIGIKLKKQGKKVIFDAHEDFPKQLLSKPYLPAWIKKPLALLASWYEEWACRRLDAIVAATPFIRDKFLQSHQLVVDINNFPILGELISDKSEQTSADRVCYVGGMDEVRGIRQMVQAMSFVEPGIKLTLAGKFREGPLRNELENDTAWSRVDAVGFLNRQQVRGIYQKSFAGLVVLHPIANYLDALPVKMFEYMSAGIPVIASDFPLWKEIIEGNHCGICVDPLDSEGIAEAINYLHRNPNIADQMGMNGQKAVAEKYNWQQEEKKLLDVYQKLK